MNRICVVAVCVACAAAACAVAAEGQATALALIPAPKQVTMERGEFVIDEFAAIVVSDDATEGTRAAARAVQLGVRERVGVDVAVVRISEERRLGPRKSIWIVEPRTVRPPDEPRNGREAKEPPRVPPHRGSVADDLTAPIRPAPGAKGGPPRLHSPANTIGVKGLAFTEEMAVEGYFIRVDPIAVVIHGASAAGSYWGAQTLIQLIRPAQPGSLLRRPRGPSIPCLWLADWPSHRDRIVPEAIKVPADPAAAEAFLKLAARYKLNGIAKGAVPEAEATRERLRHVSQYHPVPCIDRAPALAGEPRLLKLAQEAAAEGHLGLALAALGEAAWGPPDPEPEAFRQRFAQEGGARAPVPTPP